MTMPKREPVPSLSGYRTLPRFSRRLSNLMVMLSPIVTADDRYAVTRARRTAKRSDG